MSVPSLPPPNGTKPTANAVDECFDEILPLLGYQANDPLTLRCMALRGEHEYTSLQTPSHDRKSMQCKGGAKGPESVSARQLLALLESTCGIPQSDKRLECITPSFSQYLSTCCRNAELKGLGATRARVAVPDIAVAPTLGAATLGIHASSLLEVLSPLLWTVRWMMHRWTSMLFWALEIARQENKGPDVHADRGLDLGDETSASTTLESTKELDAEIAARCKSARNVLWQHSSRWHGATEAPRGARCAFQEGCHPLDMASLCVAQEQATLRDLLRQVSASKKDPLRMTPTATRFVKRLSTFVSKQANSKREDAAVVDRETLAALIRSNLSGEPGGVASAAVAAGVSAHGGRAELSSLFSFAVPVEFKSRIETYHREGMLAAHRERNSMVPRSGMTTVPRGFSEPTDLTALAEKLSDSAKLSMAAAPSVTCAPPTNLPRLCEELAVLRCALHMYRRGVIADFMTTLPPPLPLLPLTQRQKRAATIAHPAAEAALLPWISLLPVAVWCSSVRTDGAVPALAAVQQCLRVSGNDPRHRDFHHDVEQRVHLAKHWKFVESKLANRQSLAACSRMFLRFHFF